MFLLLNKPKSTLLLNKGQQLRGIVTASRVLYQVPTAKDLIKFVNNTSLWKKELKSINRNSEDAKRIKEHLPEWKKQKLALHRKFSGAGWQPAKKLSRTEIESVRMLKENYPDMTAKELGDKFQVSAESIRRILKSKWQPNEDEMLKIQQRWERRGQRINALLGERRLNSRPVPPHKVVTINSNSQGTDFRVQRVRRLNNGKQEQRKDKLHLLIE
ncbi:HHR057Cp [Eremothecium sinecaudum]|uniref:Required for respiratory growth protein 9, mitochondrial n=1 Tax=Eremothecium sinecaudum TaxID=45286 RepID=A0A0X8HW62_9SACH|nr:HHR057Cp [Eremothecium sinecaudum]AMD22826.1 HHR057Cp [Eremothecium sinecaudum]